MEGTERKNTGLFGQEPRITAGILTAPEIRVAFDGLYREVSSGRTVTGEAVFRVGDWAGEAVFVPVEGKASGFTLKDVVIGKKFHWQRSEDQTFRGCLRLIREGEGVTAVNEIGVEDYLRSVISSEMNAGSPLDSLKAHAVISRSWLLYQLERKKQGEKRPQPAPADDGDEYTRWFAREEHARYDVCADDHCQRYQGITRAYTPAAAQAVDETEGIVLVQDGRICDARYSKCCGGVTERFENVWEPVPHPYLQRVADAAEAVEIPDLTVEENARRWIESEPPAFCRTDDRRLLATVLNGYDRETPDFYRWEVTYAQDELSELIRRKTGIEFGRVEALVPVERGVSGRLVRLKIVGSRRTVVLGKELVIRQALSPFCLYSSAFVADRETVGGKTLFRLRGAGWGHGVGLCQIGAAVMGSRGYGWKEILRHYYPGSEPVRLYD